MSLLRPSIEIVLIRVAGAALLPVLLLGGCAFGQSRDDVAPPARAEAAHSARPTPMQNPDAERANAVDQLVGHWVYDYCDEHGNCETVVRIYEQTPEEGLVRYTEFYNGTENEGFVGYDLERDGFVEFDYPDTWSDREFERRYRSEDEAIRLFGENRFAGPEDRVLQWHMNEDGSRMILSTGAGDVSAPPPDFLNVIFSKAPFVGNREDDD